MTSGNNSTTLMNDGQNMAMGDDYQKYDMGAGTRKDKRNHKHDEYDVPGSWLKV